LRWFDRGDKFKNDVCDTNYPNDSAEDDVKDVVLEEDGAAEDVDCVCKISLFSSHEGVVRRGK
jgi:hypothetical protein